MSVVSVMSVERCWKRWLPGCLEAEVVRPPLAPLQGGAGHARVCTSNSSSWLESTMSRPVLFRFLDSSYVDADRQGT